MDYVAGYMIVNDVTDWAWQTRTSQYLIGKSVEKFKVMGHISSPRTKSPTPTNLPLSSGSTINSARTPTPAFRFSRLQTWLPTCRRSGPWSLGDVLSTGYAGRSRRSPRSPVYLKPGDTVRIEITGLGTLENRVVAEE